jgi:hypothetical protein
MSDPECAEYAVTYFGPTLFTKEGMDIYSRAPSLPAETVRTIMARLAADTSLSVKCRGMFQTKQLTDVRYDFR